MLSQDYVYSESAIRLHPYFVLLSARLVSAFIEDVAGYIGKSGSQDDGGSVEEE